MILMSDLLDFPFVTDFSGEKLVSLRNMESIAVDETRSRIASKSEYFCFVRETVSDMLREASERLPQGYRFLVKEGYRPASIQERSFNRVLEAYKNRYADKTESELYTIVSRYVAPIRVAGHPTGGAIDVTLMKNGTEVFMGTEFNDEPDETENRTYLNAENITREEHELRTILAKALGGAGFVNYPPEWWHWSFGDKYWAYRTAERVKYESIRDDEIPDLTRA